MGLNSCLLRCLNKDNFSKIKKYFCKQFLLSLRNFFSISSASGWILSMRLLVIRFSKMASSGKQEAQSSHQHCPPWHKSQLYNRWALKSAENKHIQKKSWYLLLVFLQLVTSKHPSGQLLFLLRVQNDLFKYASIIPGPWTRLSSGQ